MVCELFFNYTFFNNDGIAAKIVKSSVQFFEEKG